MLTINYKLILLISFFIGLIYSAEEKNNSEALLFGKFTQSQAQESEVFFNLSPKLCVMNMSVGILAKHPVTQHTEIQNENCRKNYGVMPGNLVNFISENKDINSFGSMVMPEVNEVQTDPYESYKRNWNSPIFDPFNEFYDKLRVKMTCSEIKPIISPHYTRLRNFGILLIHFHYPPALERYCKIRFAVVISEIPDCFKDLNNLQKEFIHHLNEITEGNFRELDKKYNNFKGINSYKFLINNFSQEQVRYIWDAYNLYISKRNCTIL